jgi:RNA polymerase sigma-70 factor (ECF subfamily)
MERSPQRVALTEGSRRFDDLVLAVARTADRAAFAELYRHFAPRVKAYLIRLGADDGAAEEVAQEAMLVVWRRARSFDPAQAGVGTWLFTIARNKRIDMIRRERRPEIDPDDPALVREPEPAADNLIHAAEREAVVRAAVARLPREQADLVLMAYVDDLSQSQIAERTGVPLGTVKSRFRLAFQRLRKELGEDV